MSFDLNHDAARAVEDGEYLNVNGGEYLAFWDQYGYLTIQSGETYEEEETGVEMFVPYEQPPFNFDPENAKKLIKIIENGL